MGLLEVVRKLRVCIYFIAVQTLKAFLSRIGLFKDFKGLLLNLKTKEEGE